MADTDNLSKVLDDLIDNKQEQAQINFNAYLQDKMKEVIANHTQPDNGE